MKKIFYLFILLAGCKIPVFSQSDQRKTIPADYCNTSKPALLFLKGDMIHITCDSAYLLNKKRYVFYKKLHENILTDNDSVSHALADIYELRLYQQQKAYDTLSYNSKKAENISLAVIRETRTALEHTQKTLDAAHQQLSTSLQNLEQAKGNIRKEKRNTAAKQILYCTGGVAAGLLLGLLLFH